MPFEISPDFTPAIIDVPGPSHKVSAAIRIGCRLAPRQSMGLFFVDGEERAACAIGAAALGRGFAFGSILMGPTARLLPGEIQSEVYERNDRGESREAIADWLESKGL